MKTMRKAQRWGTRTSRRTQQWGRRTYHRARREVHYATRDIRGELRPLRRDVRALPAQADHAVRDWWRTEGRQLHRGAFRSLAVFLLLATFALLGLQNVRVTSGLAISDVTLLAAAILALVSRHPMPKPKPLPSLIRNGIALMLLGGVIGLVFADERVASTKLLLRLVVVALLAFVAIVRVAPTGREVRRFLIAFAVVGAISGVVSSLGDLTGLPLLDRSVFGDRAVGLTVFRYPLLDYVRGTTASAHSIATNPNLFGGVSAVAGAIAVILLVEASTWRARIILAVSAAGLTMGVLFSGSRSSLLALLMGCTPAVWRLVRRGFGRQVLIAGGVLVGLVVISLFTTVHAPSLDRLLLRSNSADSERTAESTILRYQNATRGLEDRGWSSLAVGSGLRDDAPSKLHDGHLEIWVGLGLVGMVGWILLCAGVIEAGLRYAGRDGPLTARAVTLLALASAFIANVVVTLFVDTIWNRYIWLLVACTVTLVIRPQGSLVRPAPTEAPTREPVVG